MAFPRHPAENCTNHEQLPVERAGANHGNVDGKVRKEKIRIKKSTRDHSRRSAGLSISVTWIVHTRTLKDTAELSDGLLFLGRSEIWNCTINGAGMLCPTSLEDNWCACK